MDREQKRNLLILTSIGLVVFVLFIFPNLKGAQTAAMLSVFEIDEFAQFPNLIGMLTPGDTLIQSARNFLIYLHYFYGYPFYFMSALAALPVKILYGTVWQQHTAELVLVLRQAINVAPMIISAGLLTYIQTRFRDLPRTVGIFVFLLIFPAVVVNNLWWHPDSLGVLSAVMILFFLDQDHLRLGKFFYFAAAACGLAVGIKYTGVFFGLAIPVYIGWSWVGQKFPFRRAAGATAAFVGIMLAMVVISNPLLVLPQERTAIIETQKLQFEQTSLGILQTNPQPYFNTKEYPEDFRLHYGELEFIMLALAALFVGLLLSPKRWYYAVLLAWLVPLVLTINFSATRRTHYFLPVVLPLVACFTVLLPGKGKPEDENRVQTSSVVQWVTIALIVYQGALFLPQDFAIYSKALIKEETSPSIAFYKEIQAALPVGFADKKRVVFHDWKVYFPPSANMLTEMNWDMPTLKYIYQINPDVILLDKENINLFFSPESVEQAVNKGNMQAVHEFYLAAKEKLIPGYQVFFENSFGVGFLRKSD